MFYSRQAQIHINFGNIGGSEKVMFFPTNLVGVFCNIIFK